MPLRNRSSDAGDFSSTALVVTTEVNGQGIRALAKSINIRMPDFLASMVSGGDNSAASTTPVNRACETSPNRPNATSTRWTDLLATRGTVTDTGGPTTRTGTRACRTSPTRPTATCSASFNEAGPGGMRGRWVTRLGGGRGGLLMGRDPGSTPVTR